MPRQLTADRSSPGSVRIDRLQPSVTLTGLVTGLHDYEETGTGPMRRREPPTGLATLVFNLGAPLQVEHPPGTRACFTAGSGFFAGMAARHALTETAGAQAGVQVMLTPLGARRLLGVPLREVGDGLADPRDVLGRGISEVVARLAEAADPARRLAILEQAVARLALAREPPPDDLVWALQRLQATSGRAGIGALAETIGCSRRHLTARFHREFGIAPKTLARVLRFARASRMLQGGDAAALTDVALACGYADQSHMTRDFTEFAGCPPAAFGRRSLPGEGGLLD